MFSKVINVENRNEMINFLKNHFRYYTMNSWNCSTSYANNVKLTNLNIPDDKFDLALDIVTGEVECIDYVLSVNTLIHEFKQETGYGVGFNGRSNGYLVLYDTEFNIKTGSTVVMPGRSIDANSEDFEDWSDEKLKNRVFVVQKFDQLCDNIREALLEVLDYTEDVEDEIIVKQKRILIKPESGNENE